VQLSSITKVGKSYLKNKAKFFSSIWEDVSHVSIKKHNGTTVDELACRAAAQFIMMLQQLQVVPTEQHFG
jgi:hypothetical protein